MATLKLTPHYFNDYEAAYKVLSQTKDFRQSQWESSANKGELDQYMTVLINAENIKDRQQFYKDYNLDYSDDKTYTAALYNEILADRTNTEQDRERYITDDAGNIVMDEQGKPTVEKYKMSDYDYYKQIIKANNDVNYEKYLIQQEQERKDSMNGFNKFMATTASIGTEFVYGLANQFDDVFNSLAAIGNGIDAAFKGESISDAIVKTNASDTWRIFEQAGLQDAIIDFERRYTHMRDLDGNYSNFGKYVGGVASTLGQMAPSMLGGKLTGSLAKGLGASTKIATTVSQAASTLIFYQGMTSGNIREIYSEMSKNNVTPSSAAILANATIKSTLQWAVEVGLAKVFGGTSLDKMVFGRSVGKSVGKSLTGSAGKRILGDFVQEGLEEVFQDTSDFLVDKAFGLLIDENFGKLTNLTWQSLVDSFIIGGLASFAGSAMQIVTTKRVQTTNTKVDRNGNIKLSKLNKLASWEYGLNMQSFMQNFAILQEQGEGLIKNYDAKQGTEYATAFTEMYSAFRMITSVYESIGEERFKAANDILTTITSMINAGKFNSASLKMLSTDLMNTLQGIDKDAMEKAKDKILKAGITEVEHVVNRDDDLSKLNINDSTKQEIEKLFNGDKAIAKIVLTKDGKNVVVTDNQLFVPINYANNGSAEVLYANVAEQTLVENIVKGKYKGFVLDNVLDLYKQVSGKEDADIEEAIYNLVFNDSFFRIVLSTANKDMYTFVSSLIDIEKKVVKDNLRNAVYSQKLDTVIANMKAALFDYLCNQPNADYKLDIFTVDEQKKIAATRWCRNLYARVINNVSFKKLNENDWTVLTNRVNAMPISQTEKNTILKNLKSEKVDVRTSAMNRIATVYAGVFTTNYDGKIYMPDTTIPNRTFNAFLQEQGQTIATFVSDSVDTATKNTVAQMYGEYNTENLIKFRQSQFMQATNNKYTFRFNKQGKLGIYEASTNKQVGFSTYNAQQDSVLKGTNLDERTVIERGHKKNYLVQEILNSEIDDATAAYLSIDDVITDPSLLSEQMQADIQLKYGEVSIENTFLYLRQHFIDKLKTTTVIVLQDGSYAFGDIRPMKSSLISDSVLINEKTTIKQLIKAKYLYGRLANIKIKLTDDNSVVASYNSDNNTIFVNRVVAKTGSDFLTFAFLHEFQHAIQVENKMNIGMNSNWINSKNLSKTMRANIIKDVRKHRPELFTDIKKGSNTEAEIVNDFVYFASGESTAFGIDASKLVDFYPVIVSDSKAGTSISFSWGNSYNITSMAKLGMSLIDYTDLSTLYDKVLRDKTTEIDFLEWRKTPQSAFIMPDGTIRLLQNDMHHYELIDSLTHKGTLKVATDYFNTVPEISIQKSGYNLFVAIRVGESITNICQQTLLMVLDTLYDQNINFDIGSIYYTEEGQDFVLNSDRAENSEDLLRKYSILKKMYNTTSLGPTDSDMSLKASNENERKLLENITNEANTIAQTNSNVTSEQLTNELQQKYQFVPIDVLREIANGVLNKSKIELDKLAEDITPKTASYKKKTETKKRYVSQKASTGTNLEKYGYTAKYKKTQMDPGLQKFIVNATENIDESLWTKLTEGKLTVTDVMDYFRDTKTIDNETFKLINDSFFQNTHIKTFEQLDSYINNTDKYYAVRAILNKLGYGESLVSSTNTKLFEKVLAIIDNDENLKKIYDDIVTRYEYFKKEDRQLVISNKMLRRLWMEYFDGSTASAGYVAAVAKAAAINKWIITGEADTKVAKKLSDEIGEDLQFEDTVEDKSSQNAFEEIFYSADRKEQVEEIMKIAGPRYVKKLMAAGLNQSQIQTKFHQKWEQLLDMNDTDFARQYAKIVRGMSSAEVDAIFARHIIADTAGVNVNNLSETEATKLAIVADGLRNNTRTSWAIVNNIRSMLRTIKSNLTEKSKKRFLIDNADVFNDNFTIKDNLLYNDKNGKRTYTNEASLLELESRIRQLSKDVRKNAYSSEAALKIQKSFERKIKELEREKAKLVEEVLTGKTKKVVTYTIADEDITIDTTKQIPPALKRLLEIEFNKTGTTKTKYIVEGDQQYIKSNLNKFVSENAEFLAALSQADVDSIIDFYMTSNILPSTNQAGKYSSVQVYLMTYLLRANKLGQFTLTEQQVSDIQERLYQIVNISAKNLANWKAALPLLDPTKTIIQSLAKSTDIEFSASDVENLVSAISTGDVATIEKAKERMYRNGLLQYKGRKQSFVSKLIKFERMAMLSSPGTAIRNITSNVIVSSGNRLGGAIGTGVSKLLEKLWPKKFKHIDGQYKFIGTKVDADTQQFIKTNIVDNGFLELVRDGINKYDTRKHKTQLTTGEDAIIDLTVESIKSKIFNDQSFKLKFVNDVQGLILKMLSDNKSIDKAALRYFGKMLVEDKVDLTKGLTQNVINTFAEAYKLAAFDYMHKSNFFNTIETQLKQRLGEGAYFMYKQVFPFAAASWNWFMEGLNYTPVGLVRGILQYAKLENTIETMEDKRQKGENVVSSRFAEYLAKRTIGKGILGTIGMGIGIALAATGLAGIDEEDDKYKLFIAIGGEKITVDISNVFGTQGILVGIALISSFKGDGDIMSAIAATLDAMFSDSVYSDVFNSFRYSDSFGDWLLQQPFTILGMFIPNFISTLSSIINRYKIKYSSGIAGKFERMAVKAIPGIAYAFPKYMDPYTGETQVPYKAQMLVTLVNKLAPFKIYPYNVSDIEKEAISVGVNKGQLTGRYEINGEKVKLSAEEFQTANEYYGKLNNKKLSELYSNKKSYKVWDEKKQEYVELKYSKMTNEQKKTVIERIMNDNGTITKVYMLTSKGYKYYTTESNYDELKKLGIKNVYKKTKDKEGFVKS